MIKSCNIVWGQRLANTCSFLGGCIIVQQEKISTAERSWTNPVECASGGDSLLFIKFCIYCFSLRCEFFVHYALRVEKNYQQYLDARPLEFQFLRPKGCLTNPFRTLSLCFVVIGKTPGLTFNDNFVKKKFLSASAIAIMSWQDVTRSSLCSGVKECGTKLAHTFSFPNLLSESEGL